MNKYKYFLVPEMIEWVPSIIYRYNDILYFIKAQQIGKFNKHVLYHIYRLNYYSRIAKAIINVNYYVIIYKYVYIYIYEEKESWCRCVFSYLYGIFSYLYFLCWLLQCNCIPWPLLTILLVVVIIIVVIIIKNNIFDE